MVLRRALLLVLLLALPGCGVSAGGPGTAGQRDRPAARAPGATDCVRTARVVPVGFSATRYPTIRAHAERAIAAGWPRVLVLDRPEADLRRDRALRAVPTRDGQDRDEYPPAVGRGSGPGLERGRRPSGWQADVAYVPSSENRSHGAVLGTKLRRFCDGTRFTYVFY